MERFCAFLESGCPFGGFFELILQCFGFFIQRQHVRTLLPCSLLLFCFDPFFCALSVRAILFQCLTDAFFRVLLLVPFLAFVETLEAGLIGSFLQDGFCFPVFLHELFSALFGIPACGLAGREVGSCFPQLGGRRFLVLFPLPDIRQKARAFCFQIFGIPVCFRNFLKRLHLGIGFRVIAHGFRIGSCAVLFFGIIGSVISG